MLYLVEYGEVLPIRISQLRKGLLELISQDDCKNLSDMAKHKFYELYEDLLMLDDQIERVEKELMTTSKQNADCQRLMTLPGIGWITASALVAHIGDLSQFKNGPSFLPILGWCQDNIRVVVKIFYLGSVNEAILI